ncbi:MAG TPA: peptide-N4-asparagine amidase [Actinospica sp.]|nr:peptide-N4-asparagine amidase [Actinospica sp.]
MRSPLRRLGRATRVGVLAALVAGLALTAGPADAGAGPVRAGAAGHAELVRAASAAPAAAANTAPNAAAGTGAKAAAKATAGSSGAGADYVENGYQNPVSAFQPVSRPDTRSCTVTAMQYDFANSYATGDYIGTLTPPTACQGPWSKVVLDWYGSVSGRQYDRLAGVWIGGAEVFRTSTPEPDAQGISWHVDENLSQYIPLLTKTQPLDVSLGNVVNSQYTGIYHITLKVTYYTADRANPPASTANAVLPLSNTDSSGASDWWDLTKGQSASLTETFPTNLTGASIQVYARGNGCEEFWYSNVPDSDTTDTADGYCAGGTYREVGVQIDGRPAGVSQVFPVIYSGGINPLMWRPIMSVDSLRTEPYTMNLTPFAGLLSDGKQHTITLVPPADISDVWMIDATMFLTTDAHAAHTGGTVTEDTIASAPQSNTDIGSPAAGTDLITTSAARDWTVRGYVDTSHGRVTTTVSQHLRYQNTDKIWDGGEDQTVTQTDQGYNDVTTDGLTTRGSWQYPISMTASYVPDSTGSGFLLQAQVSQARLTQTSTGFGSVLLPTGRISDRVAAGGVLQVSDTGTTLQADGQDSEDYQSSGLTAPCYHHVIRAEHGQVTSDTQPSCQRD